MNSELSFLIDILLHHKLSSTTKDLIAKRINEVEANLSARAPANPVRAIVSPIVAQQTPSMQAIMERNPDLIPTAPAPVAVIAQNFQTAAAMESRNKAISASMSGTVDKTTGRPRKF